MNIESLNPNQLADLFGTGGDQPQDTSLNPVNFGMTETDSDLFASVTETTTLAPSTTETTTLAPTEEIDTEKEVDILNTSVDEVKNKGGRPPKYDFSDLSGYFEKKIKEGKFVSIEQEDDKGNVSTFVPKTPEEFDEVFELQVTHRLEQAKKELSDNWYQEKSPAWQAVARYAEMVDDPTEIVPFLQGIQTMQKVADINEADIEGAETLVRMRLQQRGESQDVIEEQVEALKTTDKLLSTAQKIKPVMLQEESKNLAKLQQEQEQRLQGYYTMVNEIRDNAIQAIETPLFGVPLQKEEKAAVYDMIAIPSEETKGYAIYNAIDSLFENKDFDTLRQVALLLTNKDSFLKYVSNKAANETAASLQKKLRVATESKSTSSNDFHEEKIVRQTNTQSKGTARFGRQ